MTDVQVIAAQPTAPAATPKTDAKPLKVTAKVRKAIEGMVWLGLKRAEAAEHAGLKEHSLYVALRSPHVKAAYLSECEVLRLSGKARRILRLEELTEQDENLNAAVNAVKALEQLGDEQHVGRSAQSMAPGFVIQVINMNPTNAAHLPGQDAAPAKPLIEHASVSSATENEGE